MQGRIPARHRAGGGVVRQMIVSFKEGALPCGGVALLRAAKALETIPVDNADQRTGVEIVRRAIEAPVRQIAENAGADGSIIVGKLREKAKFGWGWNAQTDEFGDLYKQAQGYQ
ncbi:hypothetical protein HK436_25290 [Mesorhizobium sediminum]|nr:hypothetical protein [Mesorhizobium sediminum]